MAPLTRKQFLQLGAALAGAARLGQWPSRLEARQQPMALLVPLAHARFFGDAELVIGNNGPEAQRVAAIWHADGRQITGETIEVPPLQAVVRSLADLFPAGVTLANVNGLVMRYEGRAVDQVSAQVVLQANVKMPPAQSLDAPHSVPFDRAGPSLEAVWATPKGDEQSVIALFNVRGDPHTVRIGDATSTSEVTIAPSASHVVTRPANRTAGLDWIRLDGDSAQPAIYAAGFTMSPGDRIPRLIQFSDPQRPFQSDLIATGLRVRGAAVTLALKNTSPLAIVATVALLEPETGAPLVQLPPIGLPGRIAARVDLAKFGDPSLPSTAALQVRSNGVAGGLIGDLHAIDSSTGLGFSVPLRNPGVDNGSIRARTGQCPVRLAGDYETRVFLTNAGAASVNFAVRIVHDGDSYLPPVSPLAAGASVTFDVRRLRDDQISDSAGRRLPKDFTRGMFAWSTRGMGIEAMLAGRAEIVSVTRRVASSVTW